MTVIAFAVLFALTGCAVDDRPASLDAATWESGRFKVERLAVLGDKLAYNGVRSLYRITDTQTGQEWVGLSGVGVSELGQHAVGKTNVADER